jgi:predicted nucleotidyltransferase component of viral defense system
MTSSSSRDVGAAVRAQLQRRARERGEDFQLLLTRYANERLLYRLAQSEHAPRFVLKGAALFTLWTGNPHRPTRDIDLLGFGEPGEQAVRETFASVLALDLPDDGVRFAPDSLAVSLIRDDQEYGGVRIELLAGITTAKVRLQVDVGFGDAVTPEATIVDYPTLLSFPAPRLRAYPRETVVAEKLEAMTTLGLANSRMKDFYDIAILSQLFAFEGQLLTRAIRATFERRKTPLVMTPVALTPAFSEDPTKKTQWSGFVRKAALREAGTLSQAITAVATFVAPPLAAAVADSTLTTRWRPGGPWQ